MISTYIFDLDGTLIDPSIYARIYPRIMKMIVFKAGKNKVKTVLMKLKKNKERRYDTGEVCQKLGLLKEYYFILKKEAKKNRVLFRGVKERFIQLKLQKKKIGVASNSMQKTILFYLKCYGLEKYVDFVCSAEEMGHKKSNLKFWTALAQKNRLNPSECQVIGDDKIEDGIVPKKAGFRVSSAD